MLQSISSSSAINTPSIVNTAGVALVDASPNGRFGWQIQNVGTNPLFVCLGGTASTMVFHFVLKGGTGNNDGLGASFSQFGTTVFQGAISVAGTSPLFTVLEIRNN